MLVIRKEQMVAMEEAMMSRFVKKCVVFTRSNFDVWSHKKDDVELTSFVREIIELAHRCNIRKEINIQKLLAYKIEIGYECSLPGNLHRLLTSNGMSEDSKMAVFLQLLVSGLSRVEIDLHEEEDQSHGT